VRGMDAIDVGTAVLDQRGPVEAVHRGVEAVVRSVVTNGLGDMRRVPHDFLGHATHVDACAAQGLGLDQCTFLSMHGRAVDGRNAAAAAAYGDVIVVVCQVLPHLLFFNATLKWSDCSALPQRAAL